VKDDALGKEGCHAGGGRVAAVRPDPVRHLLFGRPRLERPGPAERLPVPLAAPGRMQDRVEPMCGEPPPGSTSRSSARPGP
jgi:hypothetical protein